MIELLFALVWCGFWVGVVTLVAILGHMAAQVIAGRWHRGRL